VGNFLGDDKFEIGLAGGHYYVVFDQTGKEVWKQETQDYSSHRTGSTIFDFNGDGKMEVIYNDEQKLRIYSGETGQVLWETENPSGTLWEYPLVANVDDEASSELIVSSPTRGGVRVFEDPKNLWMYSRRVWNQYSYFPEIVDDLLKSTPIFGQKVRHGFRVNSQGLNPSVKAPCK
jgi:outer membrane protein assembly factor BamB